jgi:hypothetical protein
METHRFSVPADGDQDDLITWEGWTPRHGSLTLKRQRPTQVQQESTASRPTDIDLIRPVQAFEPRQRPRSTSLRLVHTEEVDQAVLGRFLRRVCGYIEQAIEGEGEGVRVLVDLDRDS